MTKVYGSVVSVAWWFTVLILMAIAVALYFIYPYAVTSWAHSQLTTIVQANAMDCHRHGEDSCIETIVKKASVELGIELEREGFDVDAEHYKKISVDIDYRARLDFPFTGTMFGSDKHRFRRMKVEVEVKSVF